MDWVRDFFADVDSRRTDALAARFSDGIVMRYANRSPVQGKAAVMDAIQAGYPFINSMVHEIRNIIAEGDSAVVEAEIVYALPDGREARVASASVLRRQGERITELRIYLDVSAVFS